MQYNPFEAVFCYFFVSLCIYRLKQSHRNSIKRYGNAINAQSTTCLSFTGLYIYKRILLSFLCAISVSFNGFLGRVSMHRIRMAIPKEERISLYTRTIATAILCAVLAQMRMDNI